MITVLGRKLTVKYETYQATGKPAICLLDGEEPFATLTTSVSEADIPPGSVLIKTWSTHSEWWEEAATQICTVDPEGRSIDSGFVTAPVWFLKARVFLDEYTTVKDKLRAVRGVAGNVQDAARHCLSSNCLDQGAYIQFGADLRTYNLWEALLYAATYEDGGAYVTGSVAATLSAVTRLV